jgi:hypothetical protein
MSDATIFQPVPSIRLPSPIRALQTFQASWREKRAKKVVFEIGNHFRAVQRARISACALDAYMPGRVATLDENSIDIPSALSCALAQVFGHFDNAPEALRGGENGVGFHVPRGLLRHHMNLAWRRVIREHREQHV